MRSREDARSITPGYCALNSCGDVPVGLRKSAECDGSVATQIRIPALQALLDRASPA
jgi:hypothetical protein